MKIKVSTGMQKKDRYYCSWWHWYNQINFMGLIDSFHSGLSYQFHNLAICIFDDDKFVNSNEFTAVERIDDIAIHMESPEKSY